MTRLRVLAILPAVAVVCIAETWRRGFAAPFLFGCRLWTAALNPLAPTEDDAVG